MRPPKSQGKKKKEGYGRGGEGGRREEINEDPLVEGTSTVNSLPLDAELKRCGPNWMSDLL